MMTAELSEMCPRCGEPLLVLEELQPSMIVPDGHVLVPVIRPMCRNGHEYSPESR